MHEETGLKGLNNPVRIIDMLSKSSRTYCFGIPKSTWSVMESDPIWMLPDGVLLITIAGDEPMIHI